MLHNLSQAMTTPTPPTPTPRVDAEIARRSNTYGGSPALVTSDFARALERECAADKERLSYLQELLGAGGSVDELWRKSSAEEIEILALQGLVKGWFEAAEIRERHDITPDYSRALRSCAEQLQELADAMRKEGR
jgi:hypothetical protein